MKKNYQLILATDLDGTFLEGDMSLKEVVYKELKRHKENILLIYTTGRSVEPIKQFCSAGYLPNPDFLIADHGTHIVEGETFSEIHELQNPIVEKWNSSNEFLKNLLADDDGIMLQPINPPFRVAYYYHPSLLKDHTVKKIIDAGFDAILSCDQYLDIVPRGVNKGSSLLQILDYLNLSTDHVITCGDSLNDLSLFLTGIKSIVVSNAEAKLVAETEKLANVYHSSRPGLSGVLEGLKFYNKLHLLNSADFVLERLEF